MATLVGFQVRGAQAAEPKPSTRERLAREWQERLEEADRDLLSQKWRRARRQLDRLLHDLREQLIGGPDAGVLLARALLLRAVSEAGLSRERDARWDRAMAVDLFAPVGDLDLSVYGPATLLFQTDPYEQPTSHVAVDSRFSPPEAIRSVPPEYPFAQRISCLEAPITVRTILGSDGLLHSPSLQTRENLVLGFAAMDRLREWRFRPATTSGKPIAVTYTLRVTFDIPICGQ